MWAVFNDFPEDSLSLGPLLRFPALHVGDVEGWRVLDLCGGLSTVLLALIQSGRRVSRYTLVEIDHEARWMGDNIIRRLLRSFRGLVSQEAVADGESLGHDVWAISEDDIRALGRIDLVVAAWPCTDLSEASGDQAQGLDGDRSALFFAVEQILVWIFRFESDDDGDGTWTA